MKEFSMSNKDHRHPAARILRVLTAGSRINFLDPGYFASRRNSGMTMFESRGMAGVLNFSSSLEKRKSDD